MGGEIERWQHTVSRNVRSGAPSSNHEGLASRLSRAASELFCLLLIQARLQLTKETFRSLEREYGYLKLWCDGYGATLGDLDVIISESKRLRHTTYRLLVSVCHNLADKLTIVLLPAMDDASQQSLMEKAAGTRDLLEVAVVHGADGSESDSDSESDSSSVSGDPTLEDIIADIKTDIQCLVDLGPRYKEPIRDRTVKEQAALPTLVPKWDPAEHLASRIRHRYPKGDVALARILGQANWDRFNRLKASKEANAQAAERPAVKPEVAPGAPGTVVASDFHDSGLGTSVATPSSYAETVLSYHGTRGGSIKIPQVPAEGLGGKPFVCDICGRMCQLPGVNWKSFWKKHVLSDLQPYVCVMTHCSFSLVPLLHKKAWIHHLELEHGFANLSKDMACPLCQETIGSGQMTHLARHLEEVALTILPANAESDVESDGGSEEGPESDQEHYPPYPPEAPSPPLQAASVYSTNPPVLVPDGSSPDHYLKAQGKGERLERFDAIALVDFDGDHLPLTKGQPLWIWSPAVISTSVFAECKETGRRGYVPRTCVGMVGSADSLERSNTARLPQQQPAVDGRVSVGAEDKGSGDAGEDDTIYPAKSSYPRQRGACRSCRKAYTKCDGERPCSRCTRLKRKCLDAEPVSWTLVSQGEESTIYPAQPSSTGVPHPACVGCRKAHFKCDGGRPCSRCIGAGRACLDAEPVAWTLVSQGKESTIYPAPPSSTGVHRLACVGCREAHLKCDGRRPCSRCIGAGRECLYQEPTQRRRGRCKACEEANSKCNGERPCSFCTATRRECLDPERIQSSPIPWRSDDFVLFEGRRDDLVYFPPLSKSAELKESDAQYFQLEKEPADEQSSRNMAASSRPSRARASSKQQHRQALPVSLDPTVLATPYPPMSGTLSEFDGDLSASGADVVPSMKRYYPVSVTEHPPLKIPAAGMAMGKVEDGTLPPEPQTSPEVWTGDDDQILLKLCSMGKNWSQIQMEGFPRKTANACRKRYERLMERREGLTESRERFRVNYSDRGPD